MREVTSLGLALPAGFLLGVATTLYGHAWPLAVLATILIIAATLWTVVLTGLLDSHLAPLAGALLGFSYQHDLFSYVGDRGYCIGQYISLVFIAVLILAAKGVVFRESY